jgi:hypothetical protein
VQSDNLSKTWVNHHVRQPFQNYMAETGPMALPNTRPPVRFCFAEFFLSGKDHVFEYIFDKLGVNSAILAGLLTE